ncbi:hypothetical protein [Piscinibacter sp. HJYY11]|uniref:hypothetical protein n=1 Tax=Piscinibacter sp. HJYY11 TaxID=2801333 RepID=UPI00191E7E42|nr:hypothetical protein [Piscinibacter sp. HJYY11]MBL0726169.1 hypothetical protein [Piscinibacter sp. HJYY11]
MSRWWPEHITVWLSPHKDQDIVTCFERELDALAPRRRAQVNCVLGGALVRYRVVPWNDALTSPHQRRVLACSSFHEAYGEASRGWQVLDRVARHGAAGLACAIDASWAQRLSEAAVSRGVTLAGLQPSLPYAHNRLRRAFMADMFWFVWEEEDVTTLLLWRRGEPLHLKVLPSAPVPLATWLDREWFLAAIDVPRCPVYLARVAGHQRLSTHEGGWNIVELPALGPASPVPMASEEAA